MKIYTGEATTTFDAETREKVGIAEYAVLSGNGTLTTSGLGSCVGIALYDPQTEVAGLAHAMLPHADGDCNEAKYADTAVPALLRGMVEAGANPRRVRAKLAGGSTMFEFSSTDGSIGDRNVAAAKEALSRARIELIDEDVGGERGRSLTLDTASGDLFVRSAHADERRL